MRLTVDMQKFHTRVTSERAQAVSHVRQGGIVHAKQLFDNIYEERNTHVEEADAIVVARLESFAVAWMNQNIGSSKGTSRICSRHW